MPVPDFEWKAPTGGGARSQPRQSHSDASDRSEYGVQRYLYRYVMVTVSQPAALRIAPR